MIIVSIDCIETCPVARSLCLKKLKVTLKFTKEMPRELLDGKSFKAKYGEIFYKVLADNLEHNGFVYQLGLNTLEEEFNPKGYCQPGGLYFTAIEHLNSFLGYGTKIGIVTVPDDSQIYIEATKIIYDDLFKRKFKTDKLILKEIIEASNPRFLDLFESSERASNRIGLGYCPQKLYRLAIRVKSPTLIRYCIEKEYLDSEQYESYFTDQLGLDPNYEMLRLMIRKINQSISKIQQSSDRRWKLDNAKRRLDSLQFSAVRFNNLKGLQTIYQELEISELFSGSMLFEQAALQGNFRILKWLQAIDQASPKSNPHPCRNACQSNHSKVLFWLVWEGYLLDDVCCSRVAANGRIDLLEWLLDRGCSLDAHTFEYAVSPHQWDVCRWLLERGCPMTPRVFFNAIETGDLNLVKWLKEHGCPWDTWACKTAIMFGKRHILQWLESVGCPCQGKFHDIKTGRFCL